MTRPQDYREFSTETRVGCSLFLIFGVALFLVLLSIPVLHWLGIIEPPPPVSRSFHNPEAVDK